MCKTSIVHQVNNILRCILAVGKTRPSADVSDTVALCSSTYIYNFINLYTHVHSNINVPRMDITNAKNNYHFHEICRTFSSKLIGRYYFQEVFHL